MWTEGVGDANRPVGAPEDNLLAHPNLFDELANLDVVALADDNQPSGNGSSGTAVDTWLVALVFTESAISYQVCADSWWKFNRLSTEVLTGPELPVSATYTAPPQEAPPSNPPPMSNPSPPVTPGSRFGSGDGTS